MPRYLTVFALLCAALLFGCKSKKAADDGAACGAAACGSAACGSGGGGSACGSAACGSAPVDVAETMIKMYVDGQQKASPVVTIHDYVAVGQTWETTAKFGGQSSVTRWQVSAKAAGTKSEFVIEHDMGQGYILAYQVDVWAEAGTGNVKKAWIGKPAEAPQEIKVMEWTKSEGGAATVNGIMVREAFSNFEIAGGKFKGDLVILKSDGTTTKTWIASDGWFDGLIKMEMDGKVVIELTGYKFHEKPTTWLNWEPAK